MVTLSLCCRHLVIDPCNRTPGHLPQSDRWLDSLNDKLTQIVCDWLSDMAWDGWRVDAGASPFDSTAFDVQDLLELRPERGKRDGQGFRVSWFSVERTDSGKTRVFDEDGDEVNADFFECEAYQRIWDAVDLLWLIFDNGEKNDDSNNRCDSLRNQSESSHENPLSPDLAIHLLTAKRSLLWLRESLGAFPGYRLTLFGEDGFTIDDAWFKTMELGCERLNERVHAYATQPPCANPQDDFGQEPISPPADTVK